MDADRALSDVFESPELARMAQRIPDAQLAQFDPDQITELLAMVRASDGG